MPQDETSAAALFREGKLDAAIAAANEAVRRAPGDFAARVFLAELLLFAGNLERSDVILDAAQRTEPGAAVAVAEFRQLLRAESARRQLFREGRVPQFLGEPEPALKASLAALVALRAGEHEEAARRAAEAEALRPRASGVWGTGPEAVRFEDFRDADDLCAGFFEVLTTTGKYYWIPTERVASLEFHPPRRPRDLAWRRARLSVALGPEGEVCLPVVYDGREESLEDQFRLGKATEWREQKGGLVLGVGHRLFLLGEEAHGIMDLSTLRFGG